MAYAAISCLFMSLILSLKATFHSINIKLIILLERFSDIINIIIVFFQVETQYIMNIQKIKLVTFKLLKENLTKLIQLFFPTEPNL